MRKLRVYEVSFRCFACGSWRPCTEVVTETTGAKALKAVQEIAYDIPVHFDGAKTKARKSTN